MNKNVYFILACLLLISFFITSKSIAGDEVNKRILGYSPSKTAGEELLEKNIPKIIKDSPAPGCIQYAPEFTPNGGCFGTTIIKDLSVTPDIPCLRFSINNCTGGIIGVEESCGADLQIHNSLLPFIKGGHRNFQIVELDSGEILVETGAGNYSQYIPKEDKKFEVKGKVGDQEFILKYTKTAKLCD